MKVVIVGLGLIGGSLALQLRECGFASSVIGVDSNPAHAQQALELGLVSETATLENALVGAPAPADVVILATPVDHIARLLPSVLDLLPEGASVADMGSTKARIVEGIRSHPRRSRFVPSHPMAGTEHSGPGAAHLGLFPGKTAVICDAQDSDPQHLKRIERMYSLLGMRLIYASSREHDLSVAYVSHLSHAVSFVLANTVLKKERDHRTVFDLAGGGFESTVRLAKSSPAMWGPIFGQNRESILSALNDYRRELEAFIQSLELGDETSLFEQMSSANKIRGVLNQLGRKT